MDLSTARVFSGDLAGAEDALTPVFALPAEYWTEALTQRVGALGRLVGAASYRGAAESGRVNLGVAEFTARAPPHTTATLELPAVRELPGG